MDNKVDKGFEEWKKKMCAPETFRKNDCADCEHYSTCSKPERGK